MATRNEYVSVRMSREEKACLEKAAAASDMNISDYVRAGAMVMAMLDGQTDAVKITAGLMVEKFGPQVRQFKLALFGTASGRGRRPAESQG